jgi:hypothetical protein
MDVPPHSFNRIGLGGILGQVANRDSVAPPPQISVDQAALVKGGVVANHVDSPKNSQTAPQLVQMGHEQSGIALVAGRTHQQFSRAPHQRAGLVSFDIVAGRHHFRLLAA